MKLKVVVFWLLAAGICYGQTNFSRGEELFMQNRPAEAVVFLERAVAEDPVNITAWLYLGIVYEQLGRVDEAISAYRRVLPMAGGLSAVVASNLGNVHFNRGNIELAEQYYSQAIGFDSAHSRAFLGRANTRIRAGNLQNAILDYEQYLRLEPRSPQRTGIEQVIGFIRAEAAAEERRRVAAEEEAIRVAVEEELRRIAAEAEERRLAEERQRILEAVSASLQAAADASQVLSAGTEGVRIYEGEFELE